MQDKNYRRKTFIDKQVQGALVRRLALHWVAFLLLGLFLSFTLQFLRNPTAPLQQQGAQLLQNNGGFVLMILCLTPVFLYDSVKLSHKFVGPIMRLRNGMQRLAAGSDIKTMKTRPGDYWQSVIDDFNGVVEEFNALQERLASADTAVPEQEAPVA